MSHPDAKPFHALPYTLIALSLIVLIQSCTKKEQANDSLSTFELEPGFKIERIASEPLISDPVDIEIDEYGRLFVVEMHGYPLDKSGSGKVKQLIDSDGNGEFDKSVIFIDSLILPNSIMRWKKGFIITDAPNVLYFEDTDNDGRADKTDTLLTGFALSNPQHNLNSPLLGIDNWIYLAHEGAVGTETYKAEFGDRGKAIYYPARPASPRLDINAGGRSVRFQPDQYTLEMTSSHSQFGHTFDAWGHHWEVGNANHIYQEVIAEDYLKRNPALLLSDATESLSDHGEAAEVFPITENPQHQLLTDIGVITSACGIHAYLGGEFPAPYDRGVFVAEPVSNLIHVDMMKDANSIFVASRINPDREFLASTDPKFRPVNIYTGPDGALYIIDYYRQIIEHPEWMGDEVVKSGALYNDSDKGRIYRVSRKNAKSPEWIKGLNLGNAPLDTIVAKLSDKNYWWRLQAQRLLIDRHDDLVVSKLSDLLKGTSTFGKLHALWTLQGLGALTPEQIIHALGDSVPGIRENAIKLAEFDLDNHSGLTSALLSMQNDQDAKVRFQLLASLGSINTKTANNVREKLLFMDIEDPWVQVAALTAQPEYMPGLLSRVMETKPYHAAHGGLARKLTTMLGATGSEIVAHELIRKVTESPHAVWVSDVLSGLANGLEHRDSKINLSPTERNTLISFIFSSTSTTNAKAALELLKVAGISQNGSVRKTVVDAVTIAKDPKEPELKRAAAVDLIAIIDPAANASFLQELIGPSQPLPVQLSAIRALSEIPDTTASSYILHNWSTLTPPLRDAGIRTFLKNDLRKALLLNAIEKRKISSEEISWPRKVELMAQRNATLKNQARKLFATKPNVEKHQQYSQALVLEGNVINGKSTFLTHCASCHGLRGKVGKSVGPDLGTVHNWSKEAVMSNILEPNNSISSGYQLWLIELQNGESLQGIIESETQGAITLNNAEGFQKIVKRNDIKSISAQNISVMPERFADKINVQEMADLLAYLKRAN